MTTRANIGAPRLYGHNRCGHTDDFSGDVGDVRRCPHNKIMYCFQRGGTIGLVGYGSMHSFWQSLNPITAPIKYARAKRALKTTKDFDK